MEVLPEAIGRLKMLSNCHQIDGQMVLDHPMTDAQSDVGSTDHLSNQHACSNLGNSVPNDLMSAFGDELLLLFFLTRCAMALLAKNVRGMLGLIKGL